jgi:hypothetical protein
MSHNMVRLCILLLTLSYILVSSFIISLFTIHNFHGCDVSVARFEFHEIVYVNRHVLDIYVDIILHSCTAYSIFYYLFVLIILLIVFYHVLLITSSYKM